MGVVTNQRLEGQRRSISRHIERTVRETERRSPEAAQRQVRIRASTRAGRAALRSCREAQRRLAEALRRLIREGLSIRETAERVGLSYHEARQLIRAAEVADEGHGASTQGEPVGPEM